MTTKRIKPPAAQRPSLFSFQQEFVKYALSRKRVLLGDDMGLGKTIEALGLINADPTVISVLLVCPAHLKLNWEREARLWLNKEECWRICIPERDGYDALADFVIVNHEKLQGKKGDELREELLCRSWDMLIVDEAHYLKNLKATRTKNIMGSKRRGANVRGLAETARRILFMSGTPFVNRPRELWPLLQVLAPGEFGTWIGFHKRYCGAFQREIYAKGYGKKMVWDTSGASNLEELGRKLRHTCMIRRLKKDVLKDLPDKVRQLIVIPAKKRTAAAAAVKREAELFSIHEKEIQRLRAHGKDARNKGQDNEYQRTLRRLKEEKETAFADMAKERQDVALAKVDFVVDHLLGMVDEGVDRILVFTHHKKVTLKIWADMLAHKRTDFAIDWVTGESNMSDRQRAVDWFQDKNLHESKVRILICTIGSMGTGHTMTATSHVVFAELDWVPANVTQAEDRAHRIGQQDTVFVQHLVLEGSLDVRIAKTIIKKQNHADRALDSEPVNVFEEKE